MTLQEYLQGLAKVTSALVGDKLSVAKGSNPIPSVYIARQNHPKTFYPYGVCDYIGKGNYGSRKAYSSFNEDSTEYTSYFNRRLRLRVAFYGNYGDNVLDTADELASRLRTSKGQQVLSGYMPYAGLMGVSEPTYRNELLTTDYEEFASITLDFHIISEIVDLDFYAIEQAPIEGDLVEAGNTPDIDAEIEEIATITTEFNQSN